MRIAVADVAARERDGWRSGVMCKIRRGHQRPWNKMRDGKDDVVAAIVGASTHGPAERMRSNQRKRRGAVALELC